MHTPLVLNILSAISALAIYNHMWKKQRYNTLFFVLVLLWQLSEDGVDPAIVVLWVLIAVVTLIIEIFPYYINVSTTNSLVILPKALFYNSILDMGFSTIVAITIHAVLS